MAYITFDTQRFFNPSGVVNPEPRRYASVASFEASSGRQTPSQREDEAHDPQLSATGTSKDNAILISDDDDSDYGDFDDGQSDVSFPPVHELLTSANRMAVESNDTTGPDAGPNKTSDAAGDSDVAKLSFTAGVAEPDQETASPLSDVMKRPTALASPARPSSSSSAPQTDPDSPSRASNASCESNRTPIIKDTTCGVIVQNTQGASCPTTEAKLPSPKQCDSRLSPQQKKQSSRRESIPCPGAATYKGGESEIEPTDGKLGLRRKRKAVRRPSHGPHGASLGNDSDGDSHGNPRDDSDDEKDYQPPIEGSEGEQDKEEDDNGVRPSPRKRNKIDSPTHATLNSTFVQRLRPRSHISQTRKFQTPARGRGRPRRQTIPSPPSSHTSYDDQGFAEPACAKFEEWPLENACLKRVTENGVTTFQLQFSWDSCTKNGHETRNRRDPAKSRNSAKHTPVMRVAFTAEEDNLLIKLKRQELSWQETYKQFTERFPGRSKGTLQVRYCTKLKGRCANKVGSP